MNDDCVKVYLPEEDLEKFAVGFRFEVVEKTPYRISLQRVYTEPKQAEAPPPDIGVSVAEEVRAKERLG